MTRSMKQLVMVAALATACGGRPAEPAARPGRPAGTNLIPRSVLFGATERDVVQISPDGKLLSWLAPHKGVTNIWVAPVGTLDQAKPVTSFTDRSIGKYSWAYTNQHILYMRDSDGDENSHLFRVDVLDGKTADLTPYRGARAQQLELSPRLPTKLLVQLNDRKPEAMDVYRLDLLTGARELVFQNDDGLDGFTVDADLQLRFATKTLPGGSGQLLAREGGAWKPFDAIPFEDADITMLAGIAPGGASVYLKETRGRDTAALVLVDMNTRERTVLAEDAKADADETIVDPATRVVQAVSFEYTRKRWQALDRSIERDLAALAKLDGGNFFISARTLDDRTWIVETTSDQRPSRYYVWDRDKQSASFLWASSPALEQLPLSKMHPVEILARDGLTLVSYLTLPAAADPDGDGTPNAPVPMLLWVHGGPYSRDAWGHHPMYQLFANRGYAVLNVNFRGSTGFGKKFVSASVHQWGKRMHDDLLDAVDWAVAAGVTKRDRVCIVGASYGGYATLVGVAMTPDVFACGVDIVGISSLETMLASIPPYWEPERARMYARIGDPTTPAGLERLRAASPLTHVAQIKRPLLILQGANDPRVKQAESEQIVAAMKQRGLPVTYALFPDEGHYFGHRANFIAFLAVTEAFLSAHLGGAYEPLTPEELAASSIQFREGKRGIPGLAQ